MPDNLTPQQRSYCMSRVKGKDTGIEWSVRSALHQRGFRFHKHAPDLPGRPDIVFRSARVAVFIDGDFWHGYRFPEWKDDLAPFWQKKIEANRKRDDKNFRRLRSEGWKVIRIWQHQIHQDLDACLERIARAVRSRG